MKIDRKIKAITFLLLIFMSFSCDFLKEDYEDFPKENINLLISQIRDTGDENSYHMISDSISGFPLHRLCPYAFLMANKYNYPQACTDMYWILLDFYDIKDHNIDAIDNRTKEMALYYLQKGALLGDKEANGIVKRHYPKMKFEKSAAILDSMFIKSVWTWE